MDGVLKKQGTFKSTSGVMFPILFLGLAPKANNFHSTCSNKF